MVINPIIDGAFLDQEAKAVAAKRSYHFRGRLGMSLVLVSVLYTVAAALVIPADIPGFRALGVTAVLVGATGLTIQLELLVTGKKKVWLINRFAAERLRSIKFQAYQFAFSTKSLDDLKERADAFYIAELARLRAELNTGEAALGMFSPGRSTVKLEVIATAAAPDLAVAMQKAYRELRIVYQLRFATAEIEALQRVQRVGYASADILYLLGAALTVAALFSKLAVPESHVAARWIDFFAIISFITGLFLAIIDNASLSETSKGRYEHYVRALEERDRELSEDMMPFPEVVRQIERVVLGELSQFCLNATQISYRL